MKIGEYNTLRILRLTTVGAYLGDEDDNDVLLPNKYLTHEMSVGDDIEVFLYKDSEDRLVSTTEKPYISLNEFAYLRVEEVTPFGAFLDWGLEKDLLVPFREQTTKLEEDKYYLIYLKLDTETNRLVATAKTNKYFSTDTSEVEINKEVEILICESFDLGVKVVIEGKFLGIVYHNDVTRKLRRGDYTIGYVYNIREDGKLDVRLEKSGYDKIEPNAERLLALINNRKGILYLTDKSDPDDIRDTVGMSKKTFKQAVGNLYKQKKIRINPDSLEAI
ncbi:S1-like domain-containing RNA-binding protein [Crocinitomicaceae bacterium]|nr:S1-like domain-containing RNA-binding protein [Crocinitomicaceae bacterium]